MAVFRAALSAAVFIQWAVRVNQDLCEDNRITQREVPAERVWRLCWEIVCFEFWKDDELMRENIIFFFLLGC